MFLIYGGRHTAGRSRRRIPAAAWQTDGSNTISSLQCNKKHRRKTYKLAYKWLSTVFLIYGGRHTAGRSRRRIPAAAWQTDGSNITSKLQCSKGRISFQHQNLESLQTICYIVNRKGTTAHKGLTSQNGNQKCHPATGQSFGVVFLCLKHYFKFENTNVSNARMNIPKAIRSLKSNGFLSISTTPILCRIEVSHPATRLSLSLYYHICRMRTMLYSVTLKITSNALN